MVIFTVPQQMVVWLASTYPVKILVWMSPCLANKNAVYYALELASLRLHHVIKEIPEVWDIKWESLTASCGVFCNLRNQQQELPRWSWLRIWSIRETVTQFVHESTMLGFSVYAVIHFCTSNNIQSYYFSLCSLYSRMSSICLSYLETHCKIPYLAN